MKITLKSQRDSDLFTLEAEGRSVQFDDFCFDVGPRGYAMLVLLRGRTAAAVIGVVPDHPESPSEQPLPQGWMARTAARWGLVSDTPIIGNAPLVYIVFSLLAEAGCFGQGRAHTFGGHAPMAPWPGVSVDGLCVNPGSSHTEASQERIFLQAEILPPGQRSTDTESTCSNPSTHQGGDSQ